jgi:hypothetical protein
MDKNRSRRNARFLTATITRIPVAANIPPQVREVLLWAGATLPSKPNDVGLDNKLDKHRRSSRGLTA